jgi:hypothetical protein
MQLVARLMQSNHKRNILQGHSAERNLLFQCQERILKRTRYGNPSSASLGDSSSSRQPTTAALRTTAKAWTHTVKSKPRHFITLKHLAYQHTCSRAMPKTTEMPMGSSFWSNRIAFPTNGALSPTGKSWWSLTWATLWREYTSRSSMKTVRSSELTFSRTD